MVRCRIAAAFVVAWAAMQFYALRVIGYLPGEHPLGWAIGSIALLLSIALWYQLRWSRLFVALVATLFSCFYLHGFLSRGISPCAPGELGCDAQLLAQPVLALAVLAVLFVPERSRI